MSDPDYRDPRNGEAIEARLERIIEGAGQLLTDLERLRLELGDAIELTPDQYESLVEHLGAVGLTGGVILADDLKRTNRRESRAGLS